MSTNFRNPFLDSIVPDEREKMIFEFVNFLQEKAKTLRNSSNLFFGNESNQAWLLEQMADVMDLESWEMNELARMAAISFLLMTTE